MKKSGELYLNGETFSFDRKYEASDGCIIAMPAEYIEDPDPHPWHIDTIKYMIEWHDIHENHAAMALELIEQKRLLKIKRAEDLEKRDLAEYERLKLKYGDRK